MGVFAVASATNQSSILQIFDVILVLVSIKRSRGRMIAVEYSLVVKARSVRNVCQLFSKSHSTELGELKQSTYSKMRV